MELNVPIPATVERVPTDRPATPLALDRLSIGDRVRVRTEVRTKEVRVQVGDTFEVQVNRLGSPNNPVLILIGTKGFTAALTLADPNQGGVDWTLVFEKIPIFPK
jgi:hypothetical protein